jgi:molecular chaperone HscB
MDPFSTLGIAASFDVDLPSAEKTHRELSRALHPDRYIGVTPAERRQALGRAIEVNEAWRIVADPIRRAEALLRLRGVPCDEGHEPAASPMFLMEMLERREALSNAKEQRDLAAVRELAGAMERAWRQTQRELSQGFASGEAASLVGKLGELRFYKRFLDEVSAIEDELAA